jgi:hypothetical protein
MSRPDLSGSFCMFIVSRAWSLTNFIGGLKTRPTFLISQQLSALSFLGYLCGLGVLSGSNCSATLYCGATKPSSSDGFLTIYITAESLLWSNLLDNIVFLISELVL